MRIGGVDFVALKFQLEDGERRMAAFEATSFGPKLDWESYVGYSEIPWEKFVSDRPDVLHRFRVNALRGDYFNFSIRMKRSLFVSN